MEVNTRIRPKGDGSLGWAYRPDDVTVAALTRGRAKLKKSNFTLGMGRPHMGGSGNLKDALEAARSKPTRKRRKKVVKRVSKKKKTVSAKRTVAAQPASKKRTVESKGSGKMIPLKTICAQLELDPKATRVKLRRMIGNGEIKWHDHSARWEFTPARAKEVRALLSE